MTKFMGAYKTIHQHKTQSDDPFKLVVDPTLYTGSGGVVLALQKISQFLKHEVQAGSCDSNIEDTNIEGEEESKDPTPTPTPTPSSKITYATIHDKYKEALEHNLSVVKKDKSGTYEHNCSSYF